VAAYDLFPAELETLAQCCRTADLIARLDGVLSVQDPLQETATGTVKAHPLLASVADQRRVLDQLLRSLALPMPDEMAGRRRSPAAVAAAQARWRAQRSG
jgi:hypothetical protein